MQRFQTDKKEICDNYTYTWLQMITNTKYYKLQIFVIIAQNCWSIDKVVQMFFVTPGLTFGLKFLFICKYWIEKVQFMKDWELAELLANEDDEDEGEGEDIDDDDEKSQLWWWLSCDESYPVMKFI